MAAGNMKKPAGEAGFFVPVMAPGDRYVQHMATSSA
jgi:hypothetical protein